MFLLSIGSAGVPWLVCKICSDKFHLDDELSNLTLSSLLSISFSYAVLNSLLTQSIIYLAGAGEQEAPDVMLVGQLPAPAV